MKKGLGMLCCLLLLACDDIFEKDITAKQVKILAPPPGLVTGASTLTFVWTPLEGAAEYRLIVVSPAFQWIEHYVLDTVVTGCRVEARLDSGSYEWMVRGCNSAYESADTVSAFRVVREGGKSGEE